MINRINNNPYLYLKSVEQKPLYIRPVKSDVLSFKSSQFVSLGKMPNDINMNVLENPIMTNSPLDGVYEAKYSAKIYKYVSPLTQNVYAIKRLEKNGYSAEMVNELAKQLELEARSHYELDDGKTKVPKFYYYHGDFSGKNGSETNNFIIMEWVKGITASNDSTSYDLDLIRDEDLDDIYDQILRFDIKGILHNDLWPGNILFNKDGVQIIDFNRVERFNPSEDLLKSNLGSFKERFLNRYLSDVYHNYGPKGALNEKKLCEKYKKCVDAEIRLMRNRKNVNYGYCSAQNIKKFFERLHMLEEISTNSNKLRKSALKSVYDSDMRCAKIYSQYFEFNDNEARETFRRARVLLNNNKELFSKDETKLIDTNLEIIDKFQKAQCILRSGNLEHTKKIFEDIKLKLLDKSIYGDVEINNFYYGRFLSFTCLNIEILGYLINGDITKAEQFYKTKPKSLKECRRLDEYFTMLEKEIYKNN